MSNIVACIEFAVLAKGRDTDLDKLHFITFGFLDLGYNSALYDDLENKLNFDVTRALPKNLGIGAQRHTLVHLIDDFPTNLQDDVGLINSKTKSRVLNRADYISKVSQGIVKQGEVLLEEFDLSKNLYASPELHFLSWMTLPEIKEVFSLYLAYSIYASGSIDCPVPHGSEAVIKAMEALESEINTVTRVIFFSNTSGI